MLVLLSAATCPDSTLLQATRCCYLFPVKWAMNLEICASCDHPLLDALFAPFRHKCIHGKHHLSALTAKPTNVSFLFELFRCV